MLRSILLLPLFLFFLPGEGEKEPLVVFLVRHAEKEASGRDPGLSPAGVKRSGLLASMLRDSGIQYVHSTDTKRTRNTAKPIADRLGLETQLYDPRKMKSFLAEMKQTGGRHLIVGHSNTTPGAVKLLGGDPGGAIDEKSEYDRLYMVTVSESEGVNTVLIRFGIPFKE